MLREGVSVGDFDSRSRPLCYMDITRPSHTVLIINPISGTRNKSSVPEAVASALARVGACEPEVMYTRRAGDASMFAARAVAEGAQMVVVAGGDGTVSDVAAALRGTSAVLGIVPCGSGNGFARALGIPSDFEAAAKLLGDDGKTLVCDNGLIDGRPFFCTCGVGFDAEVSKSFASNKRRGRLSYLKDALLDYISYSPQPYAISVGGRVITQEAFLIAVCNASQYGNNAYIAPRASLTDGLLDITVVHGGSLIDNARLGVELMSGHLDRNTHVETFRVSEAVISRLHPGPAHIDGEPVELGRRLRVSCQAANLKVRVPCQVPPFKPVITPLRSLIADIASDINYTLKATLRKNHRNF